MVCPKDFVPKQEACYTYFNGLFGIPVSTTHAIAGGVMGFAPQKGYHLSGGVWVRELFMHGLSQFQSSAAVAALVSIIIKLFT